VRIIGERHRVTGNYSGLGGIEGRAALCFVNGLKDTPLNGYYQVRDAKITGNTWVNCRQPVYIGQTDDDAGSSFPVQGAVFSRNLIHGKTPPSPWARPARSPGTTTSSTQTPNPTQ